MHARGERIIGGLRLIDVVIREQGLLSFSDRLPCELMCAVSNDFVYVHIALRPRACLPDDERELIVELPCEYFITDCCDEITLL